MKLELCLFSYAGVDPRTVGSVVNELQYCVLANAPVTFRQVFSDALISRSRSMALSRFLNGPDDVFVMVDRDIQWRPGDVLGLAQKAFNENACVGGMYSQRAAGVGLASRMEDEAAPVQLGIDRLHKTRFLSSGFTAIPRAVAQHLLDSPQFPRSCIYSDGSLFWPFFLPFVAPSELPKEANPEGLHEYLSEDWAFSARCTAAGVPLLLWSKPVLTHWGQHGFTALDAGRAIR